MKRISTTFAVMAVIVMLFTACGPAATTVPPTAVPPTSAARGQSRRQPSHRHGSANCSSDQNQSR